MAKFTVRPKETEWAAYYDELAAALGLTIDVVGPAFGNEALLAEIADSAELATLAGEGSGFAPFA